MKHQMTIILTAKLLAIVAICLLCRCRPANARRAADLPRSAEFSYTDR